MSSRTERATRIAELNDAFRKGERPDLGRIVITSGVRDLVSVWPLGPIAVYELVKQFDGFNNDNDPHSEHDFGNFEFAGAKCFFKIDYYNKAMNGGSEDPADETKTCRVLTIMRVEEY
jgi:hypothetical protein